MAAIAVASLFGAAIGGLVVAAATGDDEPTDTSLARAPVEFPGDRIDVAAVVELVAPSVVTVTATPAAGEPTTGTGLVVSSAGEIVTDARVVDGARDLSVLVAGASDPRRAAVVGVDAEHELAVLRLDDPAGVTPAAFAASGDVLVGDDVVAIGRPEQAGGAPTVTRGIVSALDGALELPDGRLDGLIRTDVAIAAGDIGGPLVNAHGDVVGIVTAAASATGSADADGMAIPISEAGPVIEGLRAGDGADGAPAASGFLGVDLGDRRDGGAGAVVRAVAPDTPAAAAGLQADDVVVAVGDEVIERAAGLAAVIRDAAPGSALVLSVVRDGDPLTVTVTLAARTGG